MSKLEIFLILTQFVSICIIYFVIKSNRDLENTLDMHGQTAVQDKYHITKLKEQIIEIEKKAKLSNDVLEVLHDLKDKGAIFEVTRIDRNDIFFHNGSVYR